VRAADGSQLGSTAARVTAAGYAPSSCRIIPATTAAAASHSNSRPLANLSSCSWHQQQGNSSSEPATRAGHRKMHFRHGFRSCSSSLLPRELLQLSVTSCMLPSD
jgi:hypothetical protein